MLKGLPQGAISPGAAFRKLLQTEGPLVLPGAHDALSARLIARSGFSAYFLGGFPVIGARYGVPDIGLKALGDISAAVRDIMSASDLPAFVDMDDGYGDVKNVVHSLHSYERLGVAAVLLEDQRWPKRCGHMAGKSVVPAEQAEAKIRAATSERLSADTMIFARTDARAPLGLDEALRRAERYLKAGADGVFVEAPRSHDELVRIGKTFAGVPMLANPLAGGVTPILTPQELYELGFKVVVYGIDLLMHATKRMEEVLADMKTGAFALQGKGSSFANYLAAVGFDDWVSIEGRYQP